tara:strand:- start:380 stop:700 length:321 start_codon:yes stop_codon:yes gene_type:complete
MTGLLAPLTRQQRRAIRRFAEIHVEAEAATPLPADEDARIREGQKRLTRAAREVVKDARKNAGPTLCACTPRDVQQGIETAKLITQAVYDFLRMLNIIKPDGSAAG